MSDRINLAHAAVSVMGRERAIAEALDKFFTALGWLDAADEIEFLDTIILPNGKLRVRFRDAAHALQEFILPAIPSPEALRAEKAKREITPGK